MPKLPLISGRKAIKAFQKIGYEIDHQTGSHIILRHKEQPHRRLTIPKCGNGILEPGEECEWIQTPAGIIQSPKCPPEFDCQPPGTIINGIQAGLSLIHI